VILEKISKKKGFKLFYISIYTLREIVHPLDLVYPTHQRADLTGIISICPLSPEGNGRNVIRELKTKVKEEKV
jgi:hypothetical protein